MTAGNTLNINNVLHFPSSVFILRFPLKENDPTTWKKDTESQQGLGLPHTAELPSTIPLCRQAAGRLRQLISDIGLVAYFSLAICPLKTLAFLLARLAKACVGVETEAAGLVVPGQGEHMSCHRHLETVSLLPSVLFMLRKYSYTSLARRVNPILVTNIKKKLLI